MRAPLLVTPKDMLTLEMDFSAGAPLFGSVEGHFPRVFERRNKFLYFWKF